MAEGARNVFEDDGRIFRMAGNRGAMIDGSMPVDDVFPD
jgi:hypothetical protein